MPFPFQDPKVVGQGEHEEFVQRVRFWEHYKDHNDQANTATLYVKKVASQHFLVFRDENGVEYTVAPLTFLDLSDTPSGYAGSGGQFVQVALGEDALTFKFHGDVGDVHQQYAFRDDLSTHEGFVDIHHAESHAHDGADGSGTVAHSDTTGKTANDHHAQAHDYNGADHTFSGDEKRTVILTSAGGKPTTTAGCAEPAVVEAATNDVDYWVLAFDQTTKEYAFWDIVLPGNWDGGTIEAQFYWTAAAGSGGVRWGLQGRSFGDDDAIDQAWGTAQEVTDTLLATGDVHVSAFTAAITLAGTPAGGEYITLRAYRDPANAGDTLAADARLLAVRLRYVINAVTD